jgi:FkbM family methyltransferase
MNSNIAVLFSRIRYYRYRIWLRITKGKHTRDEIFKKRKITFSSFIREGYYEGGGIKAYCRGNTDDFIHLFVRKEEPVETHLELKTGQVFVDVGANVGYYSLKSYPGVNHNDVKIIAIEAHPETFKVLMKNIQINGRTNITAIHKAISDHAGKVVIYDDYDIDTGSFNTGASSILGHAVDESRQKRSLEVEADTLDSILLDKCRVANIDLMKIDIEGAEILALRGASRTLKIVRKIIVEIHQDNLEPVKEILSENGFDLTIMPWRKQSYVIGIRGSSY